MYSTSLKRQWDYYSVMETAKETGMEQGRKEEQVKANEKSYVVVENLIVKLGLSDEQAAEIAEVSLDFVINVRLSLMKPKS